MSHRVEPMKHIAIAALVAATLLVAVTPTASADHNCSLEDVTWTGVGASIINPLLQTADGACDGYHGHACDGKWLDYGWFGHCF